MCFTFNVYIWASGESVNWKILETDYLVNELFKTLCTGIIPKMAHIKQP